MQIPVRRRVLAANDAVAEELRSDFRSAGLLVVNLMGSPGAGKTSLVERALETAAGKWRIGVIEGDLATSLDADRIAGFGAPVVQVNTGGACHLDAPMVRRALEGLPVSELDILLIENVGNLVCPAQFDLGETHRVVICSLPEGDDKILKYPGTFAIVSAVVLNKTDLLEHLKFDLPAFRRHLSDLNPGAPLFELSCTTGEGLGGWVKWLESKLIKGRAAGSG
jgi:hydrogenase nickel incorporation protein HypB